MNQFEQTFYQALLRVCVENLKSQRPIVEELRALFVLTEQHLPVIAAAVREYAVYSEWQQVYNDPESTRDLNKLTEKLFEVLMKHLGYEQYVLAGQRGWNIRVTYAGVDGMGWATVSLEHLATNRNRTYRAGRMTAVQALIDAFDQQRYLDGDFTYWAGEE